MSNTGRPRPDHVALLTCGLRLPLSEIGCDHLKILAEGLRQAFNDIRNYAPGTVANGTEPEVTALMETQLNRLIDNDPLWRHLVDWVGRGKESIDFDGSLLEKRPDLSIGLSNAERRFPLVVEAKILDAGTSRTVRKYCKKGIRRFVEGDYAWGNREAFMIGYVRDGSSIAATLNPYLSAQSNCYSVETLPVPVRSFSSDLAYSQHGRTFMYGSQPPPNNPGSISLWHLWLA